MESIGAFLRELRKKNKMSYREAGEKSGLSHSYIRYLEDGKRPGSNTPINPTPDTLKKLSEAYDHPYEELMMMAGYISTQYVLDFETGETRAQTMEETERERFLERMKHENDLVRIIRNNEYLSYDHKLLDDYDRHRIIDMLELMFKKRNNGDL